jgi:sugar phosphate isomerase/epimerase
MAEPFPRVHLAIDNCFAAKRWTRPSEWMEIIDELGLKCIEASTDTECDPMYMDGGYLDDWMNEVEVVSRKKGLRVVNLHSGHGTYATLGLAHTDPRNRDRFQHMWMESLILMAERIGAGVGFYCHAFNEDILQDSIRYNALLGDLYDRFAQLSEFAAKHGGTTLGVEQMYTPHQVPWTIAGTRSLLEAVNSRSGHPFYITIDTGHQTAQKKLVRPSEEAIRIAYLSSIPNTDTPNAESVWLGTKRCYEVLSKGRSDLGPSRVAADLREIRMEMDSHPHLFATEEDSDPYAWLSNFGCYSPIIHLQQTDGSRSSHQPLTSECNARGRIFGDKVLEALRSSCERPSARRMPQRCADIYLTLEIFSKTSDISPAIIRNLQASVSYWRQFIPIDGLPLDQLAGNKEIAAVSPLKLAPNIGRL